jgi:hypothetical protein
MTVDEARKWLISSSLIITGGQMIFLIVGPAFGFPLAWPKNLDLLQIVSPVFLGYLGSAAHFIFMTPPPNVPVNNQFLGLMLKGPLAIYALVVICALAAFGYSNRVGATLGNNMSVDNLTNTLSVALGLLAVTTGVISSYLFAVNVQHPAPSPTPTPTPGPPSG